MSGGAPPADDPLGLGDVQADPLAADPLAADPLGVRPTVDPLAGGSYTAHGQAPTRNVSSRKGQASGPSMTLIVGFIAGGGLAFLAIAVVLAVIFLGGKSKTTTASSAGLSSDETTSLPESRDEAGPAEAQMNDEGNIADSTPFRATGKGEPDNTSVATNRTEASDPTTNALLDAATELADAQCVIRPPKGWEPISAPPSPPNVKFFGWKGATRDDGTAAQLLVTIISDPSAAQITPERALYSALGATKRSKSEWEQGQLESVVLGGTSFLRTTWQGTHASLGRMQGFVFACVHKEQVIRITSQDVSAHADSLVAADAAARTFALKE